MKRVSVAITFNGSRYYVKGKTRAEANRKAIEKLASLQAGNTEQSDMSVDKLYEWYVDTFRGQISTDTRANYDTIYRNAIMPYIGLKSAKNVKQEDCQRLLNALKGKSKSYVHKTFFLLNGMFKSAVDNDMIVKSPMRGLTEPSAKQGHRRPLTPEERIIFLHAAENCGEAGYFCLLQYYCGLRPSEAARVKAEDFDQTKRLLTIPYGKTENAARIVGVPQALPFPTGKGYLFTDKKGNPIGETRQRNYWLQVLTEMEKVKPMPQDLVMYCLRHDYGTRCVEAGVDIETISKTMGHSNAGFTSKVYLHPTDSTVLSALEKIDAYLSTTSFTQTVENSVGKCPQVVHKQGKR